MTTTHAAAARARRRTRHDAPRGPSPATRPGATIPDPAAACAALEGGARYLRPVPADLACTEIYGGPETARLTGTWRGTPVDASFSRTDGCQIARWNGLAGLLPGGGL